MVHRQNGDRADLSPQPGLTTRALTNPTMTSGSPIRCIRRLFAAAAISLAACGGSDSDPTDATPTRDPVDPAGLWTFNIVSTVKTGVCAGEEGTASNFPITITKTGSGPPYNITARGFLGLAANVLTGTFDAENKLVISGSYAVDGGATTATHSLVATSENQMVGTETWSWTGSGGTCPNSKSDVTATRQ